MSSYNPTALLPAIKLALVRAMVAQPRNPIGKICMFEQSSRRAETYAFAGEAPALRDITGDETTIYDAMSDASFAVTNRLWKAGLALERQLIEDDESGIIRRRISQMAQVAANHAERLTMAAIIANATGYDGVAMISDSHPARNLAPVQDNNLAGTGTSVAQIQTDISTALGALRRFRGENGEPLGEMMTSVTVLHPVELEPAVRDAVLPGVVSNTTNNRFGELQINLWPSARLTDLTDIYVINSSDPNDLPVLLQERMPISVESLLDGDDSMDKEIFKYATRWRGHATTGKWQKIVRIVNA